MVPSFPISTSLGAKSPIRNTLFLPETLSLLTLSIDSTGVDTTILFSHKMSD